MTDEDYSNSDIPPHGEPAHDRELGGILARAESAYAVKQLVVARQRYRIGVAARRQMREKLLARQPTVIEWTARVARPLPIGIAAALLITAASIVTMTPAPDSTDSNAIAQSSLASISASAGTSAEMMDALIAPMTSDSLLAMALATPAPQRP